MSFKIEGLEAALKILKQPSNTQMQSGAEYNCHACKYFKDRLDNFCGTCGTDLRR